ncbi:MAG: folylpolyglutamate synthase/dihydrofolate synthase family protein [Bacteroidota bacterium]|nr:folylpolyglutamate synthase/dihydrofolate synthase family protein [Bacteroidota bacterium]
MTYKETLNYLFEQLPMFHRIGAAAYKADLDNTHKLMDELKHPYQRFKAIHVAGTNGKGSTSHMLAAVLQEAGYKVGLYTSPHLKDFRERIRINGKMISQKYVIDFVEQHKKKFEKIAPSFFEWTVALAFNYFADQEIDIAIVEVGLGGRLDSTNVITPELSVITNISFDHTNLLGNTLEKIAIEKAGIIKLNVPVVIGERSDGTDEVFIKTAIKNEAPLFFAEDGFRVKAGRQVNKEGKLFLEYKVNDEKSTQLCDLPGLYQTKNIATVCAAIAILNSEGVCEITSKHFYKALSNVGELTGLKGRWQVLQQKPLVIADTGHNEAGIKEVLKNIKNTPHKNLHFVIGMVNDKDVSKVLSMLPKKAIYYFTKASIPRALDEKELQAQALKYKLKGETYSTVKKAMKASIFNAGKDDLVFIGGSTFTVADAL